MADPHYFRITITGDPGSGKSTFAKAVVEKTGYEMITTGNIFRKLAAEKGISLTELNELAEQQAEIDALVDDYLIALNDKPQHMILDSRMGWHFVKDSLKIRLTVDPEIAVQRIFRDTADLREKFGDLQHAMDEVERRRASEISRYKKLYGVDISDENNFDLVINTSYKGPHDVTAEFEKAFAAYKEKILKLP